MISISDKDLRKVEKQFSGKSIYRHNLAHLFFSTLANTPYFTTTLRFKLGFLSYLPALAIKRLRSCGQSPDSALQETFDYLVCIMGNTSKEADTLIPVISSLRDRGQTVLIIWFGAALVPAETLAKLKGVTVHVPRGGGELTGSLRGFLQDIYFSFSIFLKGLFLIRYLASWYTALSPTGVQLFERIFDLLRWERYLSNLFSNQDFKGVAVVSETMACRAVCHLAADRRWPSHHYLHGLPSLMHTRSLSDHIYCFSSADRNYFLRNGWNPVRVHADGHPRQQMLSQEVRHLRTLEPEDGAIRLLFASQPAIAGTGYHNDEYAATHEAVLESVKRLNLGKENIRIRLHPIENDSRFFEIAKQQSLIDPKALLSKRPIAEDLAWANVVMTTFSTVSIEAAYSGCALVWLKFGEFRYEVREELCDAGYGLSVSSTNELSDELERLIKPEYRGKHIAQFLDMAHMLSVVAPEHQDYLPEQA